MRITILTLFPEMFNGPFDQSILRRAQDPALHDNHPPLEINIVNIRDFATDKHKTTDDRPYGGGPGMVMKVSVLDRALKAVSAQQSITDNRPTDKPTNRVVLTSARGRLFTQPIAQEFSELDDLTIICGHYEGVDQRVVDHLIDEEVRIGNYVLTGGEPAAIVMVDAITRLLPNVLGNAESNQKESHSSPGYFAPPQYTRPEEYNGWKVPDVLLSGNHKEIEEWKNRNS